MCQCLTMFIHVHVCTCKLLNMFRGTKMKFRSLWQWLEDFNYYRKSLGNFGQCSKVFQAASLLTKSQKMISSEDLLMFILVWNFSGYFCNILFQKIPTPLTLFKSPLPSHSITLGIAFIILGFLDLLPFGICKIPPWDRYEYLMKPCNRASILLACSQLIM